MVGLELIGLGLELLGLGRVLGCIGLVLILDRVLVRGGLDGVKVGLWQQVWIKIGHSC